MRACAGGLNSPPTSIVSYPRLVSAPHSDADNKGAEPSHLVGGASGDCRLNIDPLDLVERNRVVSAVVKLGGARAFMRGHGLGVLQRAAGLEVGRNACRAEH